ncbi:MAG TPA: 5'-3' exonuclease H3TH domain-containing protein [Candidatus Woesebacteria bacterium]|nr:5'-3' exonuclease H3TH domain-containing protein [Candidatus Woesebacteria bacterium]HNS94621.1 5'-3' exonuclease H3TH domain-containing protein [Candidatus Woesebacteria bacterium]
MNTLLIIDSHALIHRAYHAIPPLTTKAGVPTNALYGYFNLISKAITDIKPTHLAACFDTPTESFRKKIIDTYQATRKPTEDNLKVQFNLVKELVDAAHVKRFEADGYEADDVIGTIVTQARQQDTNNLRMVILTGDKDMFQLVDERTFILTPQIGFSKSILYGPKEVEEKLGIPPNKVADFKALSGDASDNYSGLHKIGPKTAVKLINEYGSVEQMDAKFDGETMELLRQMKQVATIVPDVPGIQVSLADLRFEALGGEEFRNTLQKYEMYSLITRFFPRTSARVEKTVREPKQQEQSGLF